jgi:EmrB/QacA subfamily drug resistance transporter
VHSTLPEYSVQTRSVPSTHETSAESMRHAWWSLVAAALASTIISFNLTGTNIAFVSIQESFPGTGRTELSWAINGYLITVAAFLILFGRLADRTGRRSMFLMGVAVFVVGSLLAAAAPTSTLLIVGRVVQGLGGAMLLPTSLSMVLPLFPMERRASAVATWAASASIGGFTAPSISAVIVDSVGWRAMYLVCIPILTVSTIMVLRLIDRDEPKPPDHHLDTIGVPLGTLAIVGLMFGVVQARSWGWGSPAIVGSLLGSVVVGVIFVRRSVRHPAPMIDFAMFRTRTVLAANLTNVFLSTVGLSIWWLWPEYLQKIWGYSTLQAGLAISPGPIMSATGALIAGRIVDRHGARGVIAVGSMLPACAAGWMLLFLEPDGSYLTNMLPALILMGIGFGLSYSSLNSAALVGVPSADLGQANAVFNTLRTIGGALGVAVAVAMIGDLAVGADGDSTELVAAFNRAILVLGSSALVGAILFRVAFPSRDEEMALRRAAN